MNELIFVVEEAPEGGYTARALGESIFTEADDLTQLQHQVRDAVLGRGHTQQAGGPHAEVMALRDAAPDLPRLVKPFRRTELAAALKGAVGRRA